MTGKEIVNLIRQLRLNGMSDSKILDLIEYIETHDPQEKSAWIYTFGGMLHDVPDQLRRGGSDQLRSFSFHGSTVSFPVLWDRSHGYLCGVYRIISEYLPQ